MKIGIFPNVNRANIIEFMQEILKLRDGNVEFFICDQVQEKLNENYSFGNIADADAVITLGGDGTLIKAARQCAPFGIPILGFNLGHLGFLAEAKVNDINDVIKRLIDGNFNTEERMMIQAKVIKYGEEVENYLSLNDIVLTRKSLSRMIAVSVKVNGMLLEDYYADGVIVSTPTGSTGYSLSAGGPVIDPLMKIITVTPICPHSLHSRSMVVSHDKTIALEPDTSYNKEIIATIDGQISVDIHENMKIEITKSDVLVKLIKLNQYNFYDLVREKLGKRDNN